MPQPWLQLVVAAALVLYSAAAPAETDAEATEAPAAPATQPDRGLEFRIAAESERLAELEDYVEQLDEHGPDAGADRDFRWMAVRRPDVVAPQGLIARPHAGRVYVLLGNTRETAMTSEDAWSVSDVRETRDDLDRPAVALGFDDRGAKRLGELTAPHLQRQLAVVINGEVVTAPTLQSPLGNAAMIAGDFTPEQVRSMVGSIRQSAGRAPPKEH